MGFRKPFHIVYDQMSLSDEASEKNLLIQLADRDIISHETVLERFKEVAGVEKVRLQREDKARDTDKLPPKASPFHNANKKFEIEKMDKQADIQEKVAEKKQSQKPVRESGRPPSAIDEEPRKKRVDTPRSTPGVAELVVWATSAFEAVECLNKGYLEMKSKANLRQLTKSEASELDNIKLSTFLALEPLSSLDDNNIFKAVASKYSVPSEFRGLRDSSPTTEKYKK